MNSSRLATVFRRGLGCIPAAAVCGAVALAGSPASAQTPTPGIIPGPLCQLTVAAPVADNAPIPSGANDFTFTSSVSATVSCRTPEPNIVVSPLFYWSNYIGSSTLALSSGIAHGTSADCVAATEVCTATAYYTRVLACNVPWVFRDWGQASASFDGSNLGTQTGPQTVGSAMNPPSGCPGD